MRSGLFSSPPIVVCLPPCSAPSGQSHFPSCHRQSGSRLRRVHISIWCSSSSSSLVSSFRALFRLSTVIPAGFSACRLRFRQGFPPSHLIETLVDLLFVVLVLSDRLFVLVFVPTSSCSGRFPIVRLLPLFDSRFRRAFRRLVSTARVDYAASLATEMRIFSLTGHLMISESHFEIATDIRPPERGPWTVDMDVRLRLSSK